MIDISKYVNFQGLLQVLGLPVGGIATIWAAKIGLTKLFDIVMKMALDSLLHDPDANDRALALALVNWAENVFKDPKTGNQKKALVHEWLMKISTRSGLDQRQASDLIEWAHGDMTARLKDAEQKLSPGTASPNH